MCTNSSLNKAIAIDLFCGIGGLSYGLMQAGISVAAGLDEDDSCRYAYEENIKCDFLNEDLFEFSGSDLKKYWSDAEIRILVGCAPCQPFSTHANKNKNKEGNQKWRLLEEFSRIIEETEPHIISMENVPNLANKEIFKNFVSSLKEQEYSVSFKNVFCPDYGIPQKRRRLVLLASRLGEINLIEPTHDPNSYNTTEHAIRGLPPVKSGEVCANDPLHITTNLSEINLKRIRASKPNGTWEDWDKEIQLECHKKKSGSTYKAVYGRMAWGEPSPTITTQFYNYGTGRFGHPEQDRALTIREAALLQTFPLDYVFYKDESEITLTGLGKHIGNAVPVDLGFIIGATIKKHILDHQNE